FNGHVYNVLGVPGASGIYHLGLHPDFTLGSDYGEFVPVLVSDSTTPGVYDTVHVDLDDNHVFGNDNAATVASPETSADTDGDVDDMITLVGEGYDGIRDTGDEAQVASASFGCSGTFDDGWDFTARWVEYNSLVNPDTTFTVSSGNGGHGFGTVTSPSSSSG